MREQVNEQNIRVSLLNKSNDDLKKLLTFNVNILYESNANINSYRIEHAYVSIKVIADLLNMNIADNIINRWNELHIPAVDFEDDNDNSKVIIKSNKIIKPLIVDIIQ